MSNSLLFDHQKTYRSIFANHNYSDNREQPWTTANRMQAWEIKRVSSVYIPSKRLREIQYMIYSTRWTVFNRGFGNGLLVKTIVIPNVMHKNQIYEVQQFTVNFVKMGKMTARKISAFRAKFTSNRVCSFRPVKKCSFCFLKSRRSTRFDKCLWNLSKCPNRRSPKGSSGECKWYLLNLNEHWQREINSLNCSKSTFKNIRLRHSQT